MRAEEYLSQLSHLRMSIERRQEQLEELRRLAASPRSPSFDQDTPPQPSPKNRTEELMIRCAEKSRKVDGLLAYYEQKKDEIIDQIEELGEDGSRRGSDYATLLYKRYVEDKRFEMIAREMGYSYDHIRHLHGKALKAFWHRHLGRPQDDTFT